MRADPEVIRKAAEVVQTGGLCKGRYHTAKGEHCTVGALQAVTDSFSGTLVTDAQEVVADVIFEQFPERVAVLGASGRDYTFGVVTFFNDHEDTTKDDVVMVLEKAALKAEEIL